ncbi:biotin--[acetyl-CoA-carboxylase] ligase [Meridianimarinicoccus roseus]|uniref:biotin--[biotin carboxyl-carrier protein] ligase n=1 Tax=Meridianimarinicoccus roseus TaxID=2072018 RepID=A0A2V2L698_9RHOB|nr:biotin--[acetyl-CoA-carboxylase] ligase [Meridianimarinicoccus roseus]PWR00830.1 biotin--[acetyl-CoA-carboxylase] ligase [Meridianimarinicoccus roseus]
MSSSTPVWPAGHDRRVLAEVDSTNAEAARIAATLAGPTWILALRQTAGRGRRGRAWNDPPGNFAATLAIPSGAAPAQAALRSFVAALALADALTQATARPEAISLKWPNDVLLNGAKVAGILLETTGQGGTPGPLAIGIGVNLSHAPDPGTLEPEAKAPTSVLSATGAAIDPESFLDLLAPAFARWEATLRQHGFAPLRRAFLDRAARFGEPITARTLRETLTGTFTDIDETGALVLTTAKGPVAVQAADIFF